MRILLISGSYPPQLCGVGDYTQKLAEAFMSDGHDVKVLSDVNWSITCLFKIIRQIKEINAEIIHMQYPSIGYGWSLLPQLLSISHAVFLTIHEVVDAHPLRKLSLLPFSFRANLIFTNQFDLNKFCSLYPWYAKRRCTIIPIGSNVAAYTSHNDKQRNFKEIVYFGQIRPNKGLEAVLELGKLLKQKKLDFTILIVGQVIDKFDQYYADLLTQSKALPIKWETMLTEYQVSKLLSEHLFAYLPFPDGISERRGSALAAISNKMLIFSKVGKYTSDKLNGSIVATQAPFELVDFLVQKDRNEILLIWQRMQNELTEYSESLNWLNISRAHLKCYEKYAGNKVKMNV